MSPAAPTTAPQPGDSYVDVIRSFSAAAPQQTLQRSGSAHRAGCPAHPARPADPGLCESDGRLFRLTARILDLGFAYLSSMPIQKKPLDGGLFLSNVKRLSGSGFAARS